MFALLVALFFVCAAGFALKTIIDAFFSATEQMDALVAEYQATKGSRDVRVTMLAPRTYTPAAAPAWSWGSVIALSQRGPSAMNAISPCDWRAAA
ncbi:hypothetical protein [Blastomonas sp.]|uniref:hypothetical protein n=1 Tax=Blastomonas sp. TaxID=1909299 RepID=UPI0035930020